MRRIFPALWLLLIIGSSTALAAEAPPAKVVVTKITLEEASRNQSFIGTLYYDRISHVSSDVTGLVRQTHVRAGDRIEKGAPIVALDTELLDKEILIQNNRIEQADLSISHLNKNYQRMASLRQKGNISERDYDDAKFAYKDALLKKMAAKTLMEKLLIQKRKSIIHAPFNGIILEKNVDVGDWVQMGKALISIGALDDIFIRVPVAETLIKFITMGQTVPVTLHADGREMTGIIETLAPVADEKTKNIFLKVRVPLDTRVVENMSATVFVPTGRSQTLAMIPRDAVVKSRGHDTVYTIQEGKAVPLPVNIVTYLGERIGADNDHFKDGMSVVIEGNERLRPEQPVMIVGEK